MRFISLTVFNHRFDWNWEFSFCQLQLTARCTHLGVEILALIIKVFTFRRERFMANVLDCLKCIGKTSAAIISDSM